MDTKVDSRQLSRESLEDGCPMQSHLQSQTHVPVQMPAIDARLIRACNWLLDMLLDEDEDEDGDEPEAESAEEDEQA